MKIAAKLSAKGQSTISKAVRLALGIDAGDIVVLGVDGNRAVLALAPEFLSLAGAIPLPDTKHNVAWDDVIRITRQHRAANRR